MGAQEGPPQPREREVRAHAKVNLFLAVGPRRPDGFHEVITILQALGLHDAISVRPVPSPGTTLRRDLDLGIDPHEDLAYRAAEAWREWSGYEDGIEVEVRKRIPAGAGLGGGSADAAGVLAALASWSGGDACEDPSLLALAAGLGADVPFFLGPGTRLMGGRGDEAVRSFRTPALHIVLVNPGVPSPTGAVYAQFDRMVAPAPPSPDGMIDALMAGSARAIAEHLHNDMTDAAVSLVPETRAALRFLEDSEGVLGSAVAGSGSTVFGIFDSDRSAEAACGEAASRGWWSCATFAAPRGVDVT